jgi:hypothetical protein
MKWALQCTTNLAARQALKRYCYLQIADEQRPWSIARRCVSHI